MRRLRLLAAAAMLAACTQPHPAELVRDGGRFEVRGRDFTFAFPDGWTASALNDGSWEAFHPKGEAARVSFNAVWTWKSYDLEQSEVEMRRAMTKPVLAAPVACEKGVHRSGLPTIYCTAFHTDPVMALGRQATMRGHDLFIVGVMNATQDKSIAAAQARSLTSLTFKEASDAR